MQQTDRWAGGGGAFGEVGESPSPRNVTDRDASGLGKTSIPTFEAAGRRFESCQARPQRGVVRHPIW